MSSAAHPFLRPAYRARVYRTVGGVGGGAGRCSAPPPRLRPVPGLLRTLVSRAPPGRPSRRPARGAVLFDSFVPALCFLCSEGALPQTYRAAMIRRRAPLQRPRPPARPGAVPALPPPALPGFKADCLYDPSVSRPLSSLFCSLFDRPSSLSVCRADGFVLATGRQAAASARHR